jgi:hypothetical protein
MIAVPTDLCIHAAARMKDGCDILAASARRMQRVVRPDWHAITRQQVRRPSRVPADPAPAY